MSSFYLQAVEAKKKFADEKNNNLRMLRTMVKEKYPQFKTDIYNTIKENLQEGSAYFHIDSKHLLLSSYGYYVLAKECTQMYIEELYDDDDFEGFEFDRCDEDTLDIIHVTW